jgi:hypothetical protein
VHIDGVSHDIDLQESRMTVKYKPGVVKTRKLYILTGLSMAESQLNINNPDIRTLATALHTRMYRCLVDGRYELPPAVSKTHVNDTLSPFRRMLLNNVGHPTRVSLDEVVEMYKGRKKTIYSQALEEHTSLGLRREHSFSIAFVKCEKVNSTKAPRCIQPRKPVYNLVLGSYLKHIEHRMYKGIAKIFGDGPTVMKGYDAQQVARIIRGKWNSFNEPVAIGLDATKFDMHVSPEMLGWEHSIYLSMYKQDPLLAKLLSWQMHNIGMGFCEDGTLSYSVTGKRFSGDMNTALGNCIIMCAMVYSYLAEKGLSGKLVNNGDDCVVFIERCDLVKFTTGLDEWFLKLGFRMTVEKPVFNLAEVEFCQAHPIRVGNDDIVMVRNIPTVLEKDSMSILPLDNAMVARKWLYAVGECGLALCSGVPVLQEFYRMYMRHGIISNMSDAVYMQTGMRMLRGKMESKVSEVLDKTRLDVFIAWGISPDEQNALEQKLHAHIIDLLNVQSVENHTDYPTIW